VFFPCFSDTTYPEEEWGTVWIAECWVASVLKDTYDLLAQLEQEELVGGMAQMLARMEDHLPKESDLRRGEASWAEFLAPHEEALYDGIAHAAAEEDTDTIFDPDPRKVMVAMKSPAFHEQMQDMKIAEQFGL
jgi:hypothetical protein